MPRAASSSLIGLSILALFLLPVLAYAGYSVADRWYQSYLLSQEDLMLRDEIQRLRHENLRLQRELQYVRSDVYIEHVAREQLGLARPGDRVMLLVGPTSAPTPDVVTRREAPPAVEKSSWRKLLDALFGR